MMFTNSEPWPNWSDHPAVVGVATLAGLFAVVGFVLQVFGADPIGIDRTANNVVVPLVSTTRNMPAAVVFLEPRDGSLVDQFVDVVYRVDGPRASGKPALLLVRDPLGQYWAWGTISAGEHRRVQLGGPDDGGERFEIGLVLTTETIPRGVPTQQRPQGEYFSVSVTRRSR